MLNMIKSENLRIDPVSSLYKFHTTADVLRLDLIDPVISGNKWFKLKEYISQAIELNKKVIITFGGAYSNHIVATAAASRANNLKSIGIIRGEKPVEFSHTLKNAISYGMELFFESREAFKNKEVPQAITKTYSPEELLMVGEGGYGILGMIGASQILKHTDAARYSHIVTATGTGTTLAGIINASKEHQQILGISALKNNFSVKEEIKALLPPDLWNRVHVNFDYHFGGYAKAPKELLAFMNRWYEQTMIPSDFVYTGKLFYAVNDLIMKGFFGEGSRILMIHSGGLQGNLSLPNGSLIFESV
jgi:1-aminocyclopropane-1-carboxylate deaminase